MNAGHFIHLNGKLFPQPCWFIFINNWETPCYVIKHKGFSNFANTFPMLQSCFLCCRINWRWISSDNGPKEAHSQINSFTCLLLRQNCEYSHCEGSKFTGRASHREKQSLCLLLSQTHAKPNIATYNTGSNSWQDELMQNTNLCRECIKYCTQHNIHQKLGREQWSAAVHYLQSFLFSSQITSSSNLAIS